MMKLELKPLKNDVRFYNPKTGKVKCTFNKCFSKFEPQTRTMMKGRLTRRAKKTTVYVCKKCERVVSLPDW